MKRLIIFLLLFAAIKVAGQTTGYLRFDTVMIYKVGGTAELVLMNKTKDSLGILTNYGNGRTRFIKSRALNDSTIVVGLDTLSIRGGGTSKWEYDGSNNLVNKSFPGAKIEINKRLSILDSGYVATSNLTGSNPGEGTGYKTFWHPGKAALRTGYSGFNSFDDANIGQYSFSSGYNSVAVGLASVAMGIGVYVSSQGGIGFGGSGVTVSGANALGGGLGSVAGGAQSVALGNSANSPGTNSVAIGFNPSSEGDNAAAFNAATRAKGVNSAAFGEGSDANGAAHFAAGQFNQTNYTALIPQFVIGRHSDTTNAAAVFRIGNGYGASMKRTIYEVDSNGHHIITRPLDGDPDVDSILVWDNSDKKIKKVAPGSGGGSGAVNTEIDLTLYADTSTTTDPDTVGVVHERFSVTNDKRVEHAVRYTSFSDGSNSDDGETEATAKQTIAATATDLNNIVFARGRAYGVLQANNLWREQFDASMPNIGLGAYGLFSASYRLPPIISGADVHNSGWTVAAGARYTKNITLSIGSNYLYDYPYVVEIDTILEKVAPYSARRYLQAVGSTAAVESTPGSFYNANLTNPVTIHVHTTDGSEPGTSRFRYEVSTRRNCISSSIGLESLNIQNMILHSPGGGYGHIGAATGGGAQMPFVSRVIFSGVGTHAAVSQGGVYEHSVFLQGIRGLNAGSIGIAFYKDNGTGMYAIARNNILLDQISAFTIHESGSVSSKFERGIYANNYWFSDTTYATTVFGSEFVRRLDITGNYVFGAASFVTSAADTLNIIGNIIRNISNKSLTSISTPCYSTWQENFFEFTPPNIGSTRTAISSAQTTDSFIVRKNIIHMKSALDIDESQVVLERTATASNPTETNFSNNIVISNAPATRYTKVYIVDQDGIEDNAAGMKADSNVYIDLTGNGFIWVNSNPFGGGSPSSFSLADWQSRTDLEPNSIYIDLGGNPLGLKDIFEDPDNGNWTLTNSANANLIRALYAGMSSPPTFYPSKPSYEQAVETVLREQNTSPYANWQNGGSHSGSGSSGETNTASNVGTGVGVFKQKTGVDLEFKSLTEPASVDVVSNTNDVAIQLVNDNAAPGNNKVYGTDGSGVKGWKDDPSGGGSAHLLAGNSYSAGNIFGSTNGFTLPQKAFNVNRGFWRMNGQWLIGDDSTGVTAGISRLVLKSSTGLGGMMFAGTTLATAPFISITGTTQTSANSQHQTLIDMSPAWDNSGAFTSPQYHYLRGQTSIASTNIDVTISNTGSSGTTSYAAVDAAGSHTFTSGGMMQNSTGGTWRTTSANNFQLIQVGTGQNKGLWDSVGLMVNAFQRPTARIDIVAGQHWRGPFRIQPGGTFLATPVSGMFETQGDDFAYTIATGTARKRVVLEDATIAAGQIFYGGTNGRAVGNSTFLFDATNFMLRYGTTSSNPGLQANGANLRARLADNSASTDIEVADEAYDATNWNGSLEVPTKNAVRDHIVSLNLTASTYTPTFTLGTNVDGVTAPGTTLYYQRIGNQVTVWGNVSVDATAASTTTNFEIDLPVASAMTGLYHLSGQLNSWSAGGGQGGAEANVTNDRANFSFQNGTATGAVTYTIRFSYEVL